MESSPNLTRSTLWTKAHVTPHLGDIVWALVHLKCRNLPCCLFFVSACILPPRMTLQETENFIGLIKYKDLNRFCGKLCSGSYLKVCYWSELCLEKKKRINNKCILVLPQSFELDLLWLQTCQIMGWRSLVKRWE